MKNSPILFTFMLIIGISFALPVANANPSGQDLINQAGDQFGLRPATEADANQGGSGHIVQVTPHKKGPDHTPSGEFRLPGEDDQTTHTDGNACSSPTTNSDGTTGYWVAAEQALGNGGETTIGGIPTPGSTGPITFTDPGASVGGDGWWGAEPTQGEPIESTSWNAGGSGTTGGDTFLDGTNCAVGCSPSHISTIGNPLGGGPNGVDITTPGIIPGEGLRLIQDNLITDAINQGNFGEAVRLLSTFTFGGAPVAHDPNFQPYD